MRFVSWSAATAAPATERSDTQCHGSAASERSALEIGTSAFGVEPTRTSGAHRTGSPADAGSLMRSSLLEPPLVLDAQRRVRHRVETLARDLLAAGGARSVRAVLDPGEGGVDLPQDQPRVLLERVPHLPVVRVRRMIRELVGPPGRE